VQFLKAEAMDVVLAVSFFLAMQGQPSHKTGAPPIPAMIPKNSRKARMLYLLNFPQEKAKRFVFCLTFLSAVFCVVGLGLFGQNSAQATARKG
jgi:hypothetical protein